ncbi:hypothetical protein BCR33DRAFT_799326 [Rhizoclosmatium globosum]|uniref:DNA polymerase delta catalytic subunit n=1 Tax=Rhizoclosmatium globosum TaxID=329046 RepID=A0A1Y2A985_9FUNG|nr:hypothetical protein BCR33DRAFT_799326 [Rhizoclosmatium globosum]|eukprot:ORY19083.1 hypothetical protein BCR33DRAFT_799326 [Rhizoclosmatium globosum]
MPGQTATELVWYLLPDTYGKAVAESSLDALERIFKVTVANLSLASDHSDGVLSVVRLTLWNAMACPVGIPQYVQDIFLKASVQKGMLPIILEDLIGVGKKAKADLKKETDPFKRAVLDGRQLALKISANSVYGFTGATGLENFPCLLALLSSVTAYGREMIEKTKEVKLVEAKYTIENGYKHDARVIYGNTDSVMVKFGLKEVGEVMQMRIEPILGEKLSSLLAGDHVRTISVAVPANMKCLMKFAVRTATCLGCKTPLPKDETAVCINCRPKMVKLYQKHLNNMTEMEEKYLRLWTQCQRCQGSLYQDVIYSAQDSPLFYMRKKAQKDLNDASKTMNRFAYEW